eukprot:4128497-Pleurochrysis_carterae.AAC.2
MKPRRKLETRRQNAAERAVKEITGSGLESATEHVVYSRIGAAWCAMHDAAKRQAGIELSIQ